jgi:transposase InsO family protein
MLERERFIRECLRGELSKAELCRQFGISRQCGYKWLDRVGSGEGLEEQSRAPHRSPQAISSEMEELLVAAKQEKPHWGPKKLVEMLKGRHPTVHFPAPSTAGDALKRHGLVKPAMRRSRAKSWSKPSSLTQPWGPNSVWFTDYKGQFKMKSGDYCFPLTTTDGFSRSLLICAAFAGILFETTRRAFEAAFRNFGLPCIIRSDNGTPFAAPNSDLGLSQLSVWFMQLGIEVERIEPGKPQQNGQHERMHRTLAAETTRPPQNSLRAQQRAFDAFQKEFNEERPHEGIGMKTPSSKYKASPRTYPEKLSKPEYPSWNEVRRVASNGMISWRGELIFISKALSGHDIAFEPLNASTWAVRFFKTEIARLDEHTLTLGPPPKRRAHTLKLRASPPSPSAALLARRLSARLRRPSGLAGRARRPTRKGGLA